MATIIKPRNCGKTESAIDILDKMVFPDRPDVLYVDSALHAEMMRRLAEAGVEVTFHQGHIDLALPPGGGQIAGCFDVCDIVRPQFVPKRKPPAAYLKHDPTKQHRRRR